MKSTKLGPVSQFLLVIGAWVILVFAICSWVKHEMSQEAQQSRFYQRAPARNQVQANRVRIAENEWIGRAKKELGWYSNSGDELLRDAYRSENPAAKLEAIKSAQSHLNSLFEQK
jgi:hypothetical protein